MMMLSMRAAAATKTIIVSANPNPERGVLSRMVNVALCNERAVSLRGKVGA